MSGRILLTVEEHGEAYYINPVNLRAYYLGCPTDAFFVMTNLSLGISDKDLTNTKIGKITQKNNQSDLTQDTDFSSIKGISNDRKDNVLEENNPEGNDIPLTPPIPAPVSFGGGGGGGGSSVNISNKYQLKINIRGLGSELNYGEGTYSINKNQEITLEAVPADFYVFVDWRDENNESLTWNHSYSFVLNKDRELTAVFIKNPKVITNSASDIRSDSVNLSGEIVQMGDVASGTASFMYRKINDSWTVINRGSVTGPTTLNHSLNVIPGQVYEYYTSLRWYQDGVYMSKDATEKTFATPKTNSLQIEPENVYFDQEFLVSAEIKNLLATTSSYIIDFYEDDNLVAEKIISLEADEVGVASTSQQISDPGRYNIRVGEKTAEVEIFSYPFSSSASSTSQTHSSSVLEANLVNIGLESSVLSKFQYRIQGETDWQDSSSQDLSEIGIFSGVINGLSADTTYESRNVISWEGGSYVGDIFEFKTKKSYSLMVGIDGLGTVDPDLGEHIYQEDSLVEILAEPAINYHFVNWIGDTLRIENTVANSTIIMIDNNYSITAVFSIDTYEVDYLAGDNGYIIGTASQTVNYASSTISVIAEPNEGYYFVGWSDGKADNPRFDENVTESFSVTANFLPTFICGINTVNDVDNNIYNTVSIGSQCWLAENLKTTKYSDGSDIVFMSSSGTWVDTGATEGYYAWYGNNIANKNIYGALYNFNAAANPVGICPEGWHLPSDDDFKILESFLGMTESQINDIGYARSFYEGNMIKSARTSSCPEGEELCIATTTPPSWSYKDCSPNPDMPPGTMCFGVDTYNFSALPSGFRAGTTGSSVLVSRTSYFWSITGDGLGEAWFRSLHDDRPGIRRDKADIRSGFSVRCIKD